MLTIRRLVVIVAAAAAAAAVVVVVVVVVAPSPTVIRRGSCLGCSVMSSILSGLSGLLVMIWRGVRGWLREHAGEEE